MTGTERLEMKLHKQSDEIARLNQEVKELKEELQKAQDILKNIGSETFKSI